MVSAPPARDTVLSAGTRVAKETKGSLSTLRVYGGSGKKKICMALESEIGVTSLQ